MPTDLEETQNHIDKIRENEEKYDKDEIGENDVFSTNYAAFTEIDGNIFATHEGEIAEISDIEEAPVATSTPVYEEEEEVENEEEEITNYHLGLSKGPTKGLFEKAREKGKILDKENVEEDIINDETDWDEEDLKEFMKKSVMLNLDTLKKSKVLNELGIEVNR